MTELEKVAYAKLFIDKLAMGINPIDNSAVPENELINNVRISRCFTYVSGILGQVIDNGGVRPKKRLKSRCFSSQGNSSTAMYILKNRCRSVK